MNHKLIEKKDEKTNKGYYEMAFDSEEWKKIQKDVYNTSKKNLEVSGFRKGNVPEEKVKEILTDNIIIRRSINRAISVANEFLTSSKTYTKPLNSDVIIEIKEATKSSLIIKFNFTIRPKVDISSLSKLKINIPKRPRIVESDLQKQVENWLKSKGTLQKVKKSAVIGNVVNIDFKGMIKNKEFEGGAAKNFNLELGSKRFIPGFEEQLAGIKENDTKKIKVTFPDKYPVENLAKKEAVFEVKVNSVNEIDVPVLSDKYIAEQNLDPKIKTMADFRMYFRNSLVQQANQSWNNQISNIIIEKIGKEVNIDIHKTIIDSEIKNTNDAFLQQAKSLKISPEQLAQRSGLSPKNYSEELELIATNKIKLTLIFREWITINKLAVTDKDLKQKISEYKKTNKIEEKIDENNFKFKYLNDLAWSEIRSIILKNSTKDDSKAKK